MDKRLSYQTIYKENVAFIYRAFGYTHVKNMLVQFYQNSLLSIFLI